MQIVLKRRSREQETKPRFERPNCFGKGRGLVFKAMGLVNDEVGPCEFVEDVAIEVAHFVSGDADIPRSFFVALSRLKYIGGDVKAFILGSVEFDRGELRSPAGEFVHPVGEGGFGYDDEVGSGVALEFAHIDEDGDGLHCLRSMNDELSFQDDLMMILLERPSCSVVAL